MGLLAFLAGAKRWFNPEMAKAFSLVVVALICVMGLSLVFGAGQSAGSAKRDVSWLSKLNAANVLHARYQARLAARTADAAEEARLAAEKDRDEAIARSAAIAAELAKLTGDPIVYPRSLALEMRK